MDTDMIVDVPEGTKISKRPDKTCILLDGAGFLERGLKIQKVELRSYETVHKTHVHAIVTTAVYTDGGNIEMLYSEGNVKDGHLEDTARFIMSNLGISGIVLRSIIALEGHRTAQ